MWCHTLPIVLQAFTSHLRKAVTLDLPEQSPVALPAAGTASANVRRQVTVRLSCRYRAPAGALPGLAWLSAGSGRARAMFGGRTAASSLILHCSASTSFSMQALSVLRQPMAVLAAAVFCATAVLESMLQLQMSRNESRTPLV